MKKLILFVTILLGVNIGSYCAMDSPKEIDEINKEINKELSLFYGGYENIYSSGINKQNINFILAEIEPKNAKDIEYDFNTIPDGKEISLSLDERVELKNISNVKKLKVIGKTYKKSLVDLKKEGKDLNISFSSIGEYKISFTDKNQITKEVIFRKNSRFHPYSNEIENNIESAYSDEDINFLNKNLLLLETFFPDSDKLEKSLFYALDLSEKNKDYNMVRNISKKLVNRYKLDDEKKEEIIKIYLNALKELGKTDEYLKFLEKLSTYNSNYKSEYLDASINYKSYNLEAIKLAKVEILSNSTPKLLNYLGDYYYRSKNYDKAIIYYKQSENFEKLALIYLKTDDKVSYENLKMNATPEELNEIKQINEKYSNKIKLEQNIGTAEKYVQEGRLQEAELYYKQSLKKDISPELKNNIYYKLTDLYYNLNELDLAKTNLKLVDVKTLDSKYLGNYYYLGGIIYYNLENYDESSKYFKELVDKFPNTVLSNKGRILYI